MKHSIRRRKRDNLSADEISILRLLDHNGASTAEEVAVATGKPLLAAMRLMHALVDKRLLKRRMVAGSRLYNVRAGYKHIRTLIIGKDPRALNGD